MTNVTRYEYSRTRGWWVRFQVGDKSNVVSKLFSDRKHGGKRKAKAAAEAYTDRVRPRILYQRPPKPGPGPGSVVRKTITFSTPSDDLLTYRAWTAWILVAPGRHAATKWSIDKWGSAKAKAQVLAWLERKRREQRKNFKGRVSR